MIKRIRCLYCETTTLEVYKPKKTDKHLLSKPKTFTYVKCYKCKKTQCKPK